jgi:tRNA U38,U39,U40 pseudouridine synthase TruA
MAKMLHHELIEEDGILVLTPEGPLDQNDFAELSRQLDPYLETEGKLDGLMIYAKSFPGWENFAALVSHLRFVKDHQREIRKVAVVSDSAVLSIGPRIAEHFLAAEVRHFEYAERDRALAWLGC